MQIHGKTEAYIFGYRLDCIEVNRADTARYEVTSPNHVTVIACFPDRPPAERFTIMRELRQISTRSRSPAY